MNYICFSFLLYGVFASSLIAQPTPIASWQLDETSGLSTLESITQTSFTIEHHALQVERVPGVSGQALRPNGYGQWVQGTLPFSLPNTQLSFSGWFALESYPVSEAGFFASQTYGAAQGMVIGVNRLGKVVIGINNNQLISTAESSEAVPKFEWVHIVATVNTSTQRLKVYLNEQVVIDKGLHAGNISWPVDQSLMFGAHPSRDSVGIYPVNLLNGIMDEINLYDTELSQSEVSTLNTSQLPTMEPDLSIPESRFDGDHHRPIFHAIPDAAWTNEPHGLIYHQGVYHIFYQKNANGPYWSHINWGHMTSPDLVVWEDQRPILSPEFSYDQVGIWSGHTVIDDGVPTIMYTGVDGAKASMALATGNHAMDEWTKFVMNPVVPTAPGHVPHNDFRDPFLWKDGTTWNMIVGSGNNGSNPGGMLFHYQSSDLTSWNYVGKFHSGRDDLDQAGHFWEMPVLTQIDGKWVLIVNSVPLPGRPAQLLYWIGSISNNQFVPDQTQPKLLEVSNWMLAPTVMQDSLGRTIAIGIIPDLLPDFVQKDHGWANCYTLPRIWSLSQDDVLLQSPHPDLKKLRGQHYHWDSLTVDASSALPSGPLKGNHWEMKARIQRGTGSRVGFVVGKASDGSEQTKIFYNPGIGIASIDLLNSTTNQAIPRPPSEGVVEFEFLQPFDIHVFVDGSVIEVFTNDGRSFAARFFPEDSASNEIDVFVDGGNATFLSLDIWEMRAMDDPTVGIDANQVSPPLAVSAHPNPFSTEVELSFDLPEPGEVVIRIFDLQGKLVKTLPQGMLGRGSQQVFWDGTNQFGDTLSQQLFVAEIWVNGKKSGNVKMMKL